MWKTVNKKHLVLWGVLLFFLAYFIYFLFVRDNWILSARDLEIKTIDTKKDFEDIIVKWIYDKVIESCTPIENNKNTRNSRSVNSFERDFQIRWESLNNNSRPSTIFLGSDKVSELKADGAGMWFKNPISIDFWWSDIEELVTQWVNFSQTNIQKQSVDEWDILKQTKDFIFYYSKEKSKIYIIKSPLNWEDFNLSNVEIFLEMVIPSDISINWELFVWNDRLIYLASKESYDNYSTVVWVYDISDLSNWNIKQVKKFETKWEYFKSRLIDDKLYLISNFSLKPFKNKYCKILESEKSSISEFISFFIWIDIWWIWINNELFNELKDELEYFSYNVDWSNHSLEEFKMFYRNKDLKDSIENMNFSVMSVIDTNSSDSKNTQSMIFWNLDNWEIHMTLENLYLVNSYYQDSKWECKYIDVCYKTFSSNNFTSISKIWYSWYDLNYETTSIIPWKPLNQYSMDEDEWYFRIFTARGSWNRDASLFVFDKKLRLIWEIENIKPGEEFKSSRFIWDKAYLVTFRQRDPLFVIDLHVPSDPKIIWELHIPWFSSYLHPYWRIWSKDYLIWIWEENNNVKVDLYEVDYDKKDQNLGWNYIKVIQKYKYIFNWSTSNSPAQDNPRSFVWDSDYKKLYLPISINSIWWFNKILNKENSFNWVKVLSIDITDWIELDFSWDIWKYNIDIDNSRVWYYKTKEDIFSFFIEAWSINFFNWEEGRSYDFR